MDSNVEGQSVSPNDARPLLPAVSLRDYFAGLAMQSYTQVWNGEISQNHRKVMLSDMVTRYGYDVKINDAIALMSYEIADSMLSARNGR